MRQNRHYQIHRLGYSAIEWAVSDLGWISESIIFYFRIWTDMEFMKKFRIWSGLQNFHIRTALVSSEISDLLLFFSYFVSQNKEIMSGKWKYLSQDWNQILELSISKNGFGTSSRMQEMFQALRTRYNTYASFKISAKLLDEVDISEVLNCWKWPQELVWEGHKCPLVARFEPRSWQPNRCLVPPTSSGNEQKWKGY